MRPDTLTPAMGDPRSVEGEAGRRAAGWPGAVGALAVASYLPLLLSSPGKLAADTKIYLYLDPARFMRQAVSMWDPSVGLGEVTHQKIGYLLPMGPWFWLGQHLRVPMWVSQRLFEGSVVFAAGLGALVLLGHLGHRRSAAFIGALLYGLSPYLLSYLGRESALLMPWAALPWLVVLVDRVMTRGGWRDAALFSLVAAAAGSVNATALVYAGVGVLLWLGWAACSRRVSPAKALAAAAKVGVGSVLVSAWWIAGLFVEAVWGRPILAYTESVQATGSTSLASEVIRGLGYWYFYGRDASGPWVRAAVGYTQHPWLILVSFAVPSLALLGAVTGNSPARGYFVACVALGVLLAGGAYPVVHPTLLSSGLRAFLEGSTAGTALRSTDRAVPVVLLGLAGLAAAGLDRLAVRRPGLTGAALTLCLVLIVADIPSWWLGQAIGSNLLGPSRLPPFVLAAADYLSHGRPSSRVLAIPGESFAVYTWGATDDPVLPGLLHRPYVDRQLVPQGGAATADLLQAVDDPMQDGAFVPASLAPLARLIGAGDVELRSDLLVPPDGLPHPPIWPALASSPPGLGRPVDFGPSSAARPAEGRLGAPAVAVFPVSNPRPLVRAEPERGALLVDGNGAGLVDLASAGLLGGDSPVLYAASLDAPAVRQLTTRGATLVLTDTNALVQDHYTSVEGESSYVLQRPHNLQPPPGGAKAELFPGAGLSTKTLAQLSDVITVSASSYGSPGYYLPEDRPSNAFDAYPETAWEVSGSKLDGQWVQVELPHPVRTDHLTLLQAGGANASRWITAATVTFDRSHPLRVSLGAASRHAPGQRVDFPARSFRVLRVRIDSIASRHVAHGGAGTTGAVGFASVKVPGVTLRESLQLPTDLLAKAGSSARRDRLIVVLTRRRVGPLSTRRDPEVDISRSFYLPAPRRFALSGIARPVDGLTTSGDCQYGLLRVDGHPVGLQLGATPLRGEAGGYLLSGCGDAGSGLYLSAGWHRLRTAPAWVTGLAVDQLVLDSPAEAPSAPSENRAGRSLSQPAVKVLAATPDHLRVEVAPATSAFWLVLGESLNTGWKAVLPGGTSLGPPRLVDGFANGWQVIPGSHGWPVGRPVVVDLTWAPQKVVRLAEGLSAATGAACLGVVAWELRRRLRRSGVPPGDPGHAGLTRWGRAAPITRPSRARVAAAVVLVAGLGAAAVGPPLLAPVLAGVFGATVLAGARWRRLLHALGLAAPALCMAAGLFVAIHQVLRPTPPGGLWPSSVALAGPTVWAGLLCLIGFTLLHPASHSTGSGDP